MAAITNSSSSSVMAPTVRVIGWIATAICAAAFVVGLLGTLGILPVRIPHLAPVLAGAGAVAFLVAMSFMIKDVYRSCREQHPHVADA